VPGSLIAHIGIAVEDLEQAIKRFQLLTGQDNPQIEEVPDQKVRVAIFSGTSGGKTASAGRIELLAATAPDSPVAKFIARRGEGLHHVCVYVDDIEKKLSELKAAGVKLIDEVPRTGAGGKKIAFMHPAGMNGVLVELEEREDGK
jgi:methylmalonyl-CoA/ethylmalonyl-CoA epimerase